MEQHYIFAGVEIIFLTFGLYLFGTVLTYLLKKYFCEKKSVATKSEWACVLLDVSFFIFICIGLGRFSVNLYWLVAPPINNIQDCVLKGRIVQVLHITGYFILVIFLWLRQSILQNNIQLKNLVTPCSRRFSWILFACILLLGSSLLVAISVTKNDKNYVIKNQTGSCFRISSGNDVVVFVGYALALTMQISLLSLFVLILRRHRSQTKGVVQSGARRRPHVTLGTLMRNCCLATATSTLVALSVMITDVFVRRVVTQAELSVLWDVDSFVTMFCIVFCYKTWRRILVPCGKFQCGNNESRNSTSTSNQGV